jgi:hypothetical protein
MVQNEFTQLAPVGQTRHDAPQAWLSLVVSTHRPPQSAKPGLHDTWQVVPEHVSVAFVAVLQAAHAPAQQMELAPHDVPSFTLPVSAHVGWPVAHDVVPVWHADGEHALPAVHDAQVPLSQTMFVPQDVPFVTFPFATHVCCPVLHEVAPVLHWTDGVHVLPAVHDEHVPLSQTMFVPQDVPLPALPVGVQVCWPVVHEVVPVWHADGEHGVPAVHAVHEPLLQTSFVPQGVPLVAFVALTHVVDPVEHETVPTWHTFPPGLHDAPAVHAPHCPALQTWLVPHGVPFAACPVCVQTGAPVVHDTVPVRHVLLLGEQALPVAHVTHAPALHTWPVPQGVPSATLLRPVHVEVPVAHEVVPVLHWLPVGLHDAPLVQATQLPEEQTLFVPQLVPSAAFVPVSVQRTPPSVHERVPTWHGFDDGAHAEPLEQGAHAPFSQ